MSEVVTPFEISSECRLPIPAGLPSDSVAFRVEFDNAPKSAAAKPGLAEAAGAVLWQAPAPHHCTARSIASAAGVLSREVRLLIVPRTDSPQDDLTTLARNWVDSDSTDVSQASQWLTLQGADLIWTAQRVAIVAPVDRWQGVLSSVLEFVYFEAELSHIEKELMSRWDGLEADSPLAFDFDERALKRRPELAARFRQVISMRARLAKISPYLLGPHVHPPTLAHQINERMRERMRVEYRSEFVSDQLEVFEQVYEACGQRASDFGLTRSSNTLEWVIILLLICQSVLLLVDLLSTAGG